MFNWLKSKVIPHPTQKQSATSSVKQGREDLIKAAQANARLARESIGQDNLNRLAELIKKKEAADNVSPAVQARKILEHMDKGHIADFLKTLYDEKSPTKH